MGLMKASSLVIWAPAEPSSECWNGSGGLMPRMMCQSMSLPVLSVPPAGLLHPMPRPQRPWSELSVDFVTGLPPSEGNMVILTVVDRFSKMVKFIPSPKLPSAKQTAELQNIVTTFGFPRNIPSDRATVCGSVLGGLLPAGGGVSEPLLWTPPPDQCVLDTFTHREVRNEMCNMNTCPKMTQTPLCRVCTVVYFRW